MSVTEHELKERAVAPRVTQDYLEEQIASEHYFTAADAAEALGQPVSPTLRCLTFCVLVLRNGFTVTGQSACADPANYQADIGGRLARQNAVNQVWPLLGYELRTKLALVEAVGPITGTMADFGKPGNYGSPAQTYVGTKVIHATPMNRRDYNVLRGWQLPADENGADEGYLVEYADGGAKNVEGFAGYVSWSPKDVFERAYVPVGGTPLPSPAPEAKPATTWLDRLTQEKAELLIKTAKLDAFLRSPAFGELPFCERMDLAVQCEAMNSYLNTLTRRLSRAVGQ